MKSAGSPGEGPEPKKKVLALFDFDGTLTSQDTLPAFIRFVHGDRHYYQGLASLFPDLLLYKLRILSNQKAKERMLTYFFKGMAEEEFRERCAQFAVEAVPRLLRPAGVGALQRLKSEGARIIVVSASPENWVHPWSSRMGAECIATKLEVEAGKITGRIAGMNCHGIEKVNRIRNAVDLSNYDDIYAYGDSKGDSGMLDLATRRFYRSF